MNHTRSHKHTHTRISSYDKHSFIILPNVILAKNMYRLFFFPPDKYYIFMLNFCATHITHAIWHSIDVWWNTSQDLDQDFVNINSYNQPTNQPTICIYTAVAVPYVLLCLFVCFFIVGEISIHTSFFFISPIPLPHCVCVKCFSINHAMERSIRSLFFDISFFIYFDSTLWVRSCLNRDIEMKIQISKNIFAYVKSLIFEYFTRWQMNCSSTISFLGVIHSAVLCAHVHINFDTQDKIKFWSQITPEQKRERERHCVY